MARGRHDVGHRPGAVRLVADAVATIAMVLAPHQGIAFVDRLPEAVAALLVEADGTQHVSARWPTGAGVSR